MRELIERLEGHELTEAVSMGGIQKAYKKWRDEIKEFEAALMKAVNVYVHKGGKDGFLVKVVVLPSDDMSGAAGAGYLDMEVDVLPPYGDGYPEDMGKWLQKQTGVRWQEQPKRGGVTFTTTARPSFR